MNNYESSGLNDPACQQGTPLSNAWDERIDQPIENDGFWISQEAVDKYLDNVKHEGQ
jgi:hypothetical protein